jgi:hypothetical protein
VLGADETAPSRIMDGSIAVGDPKHWHLFRIVARKR